MERVGFRFVSEATPLWSLAGTFQRRPLGTTVRGYEVEAAALDGAVVQAGKRQFVRFRAG